MTAKKSDSDKKLIIAVIGSGQCSAQEAALAEAVGRDLAKRRDILLQFLIESAALSFTGGLIGLLIGLGTISLIGNVPFLGPRGTTIQPEISPTIVILALAVSIGTGLISGFPGCQTGSDRIFASRIKALLAGIHHGARPAKERYEVLL